MENLCSRSSTAWVICFRPFFVFCFVILFPIFMQPLAFESRPRFLDPFLRMIFKMLLHFQLYWSENSIINPLHIYLHIDFWFDSILPVQYDLEILGEELCHFIHIILAFTIFQVIFTIKLSFINSISIGTYWDFVSVF